MLDNPCKPGCPKRNPTCHATCDDYFVYSLCKEYERKLKHREKQKDDDVWATSRHSKNKRRGKPYADKHGAF